jgi:hypothetical protein
MRTYDPAEFVSALASKQQLDEPMDLTLYGLVKADESDSSVLLFSISTSCEQWISIPASLISSIQHGGNASCKDHRHPFVRIVLSEPNKDDVSAVLFARLFAQANAKAAAAQMKALSGGRGRRRSDCETFTFDDKPMVCCPPPGGRGSWDCFTLL